MGPHPKTEEPRRNVRQVKHSAALLAFVSVLASFRGTYRVRGRRMAACFKIEYAVEELVRVRARNERERERYG